MRKPLTFVALLGFFRPVWDSFYDIAKKRSHIVKVSEISCVLNISKEAGIRFFSTKVTQLRCSVNIEFQSLKFKFYLDNREGFRDTFKKDLLWSFFMVLNSKELGFGVR